MMRIAVILFAVALIAMYLTWRFGIRHCLVQLSLPVHTGRLPMIRDGFTLFREARKRKAWPQCLQIFVLAAFVALTCLLVPAGRIILSNQHLLFGEDKPMDPPASE